MKATVVLEYKDARTAKAVAAAISPDNLKAPADMTVTTIQNGKAVKTEIDTKGKMETFIATVDDLLFCISVAERALKTME